MRPDALGVAAPGVASAFRVAALSVGLALLAALSAMAEPAISVAPTSVDVPEAGTLWVEITINDEVLGVTGYDLLIDFDESVLELLDVEEGDLPQGYPGQTFMYWTDEGTASDALDVNGAMMGGSVDGPGSLIRARFLAVATGTSPVEFSYVDLRDIDNQTIEVSASAGEIHVTPVGRIYFDPGHTEVDEFEHFWVDISVDAAMAGVTGYELVVDFDEDLLEVLNVSEGALPEGYPGETFLYWTAEGTASDALVVNGAVLGGSVDGPGSLLRVEFEALASGVSYLTFSSVELRDIENAAVPAIEEDGDVEIGSVGRVYVDPAHKSVWVDSDFCVDVAVDDLVHGLTGFHLLIDFDESLLDPTDVHAAELMTDYPGYPGSTVLYWSGTGQQSDALLIDGAFLGGSVDGPGSLLTICFHASAPGLTPLEFMVVEFRDLDNNDILVGSVPGEVDIETEPSNAEFTTWGGIKARFR